MKNYLEKNLINCYVCGSSKTVKKSIMAPSVATSKTSTTQKDTEQKKEFLKNVKSKIRELNDFSKIYNRVVALYVKWMHYLCR